MNRNSGKFNFGWKPWLEVFGLDLREPRFGADLMLSKSCLVHKKLIVAFPCLLLSVVTDNRPVPDNLRGLEISFNKTTDQKYI